MGKDTCFDSYVYSRLSGGRISFEDVLCGSRLDKLDLGIQLDSVTYGDLL